MQMGWRIITTIFTLIKVERKITAFRQIGGRRFTNNNF